MRFFQPMSRSQTTWPNKAWIAALKTIAAVAPIAPTLAMASADVSPTVTMFASTVISVPINPATPAIANGIAIVVPTAIDVPMAKVLIFPDEIARGRIGSRRQTARNSMSDTDLTVQSSGLGAPLSENDSNLYLCRI